ncbi:hypothetical protein ABK040_015886 [Willaertia magna]
MFPLPLLVNNNNAGTIMKEVPALRFAIEQLLNVAADNATTNNNNTTTTNTTKPILTQTQIISTSITLSFGSFVFIPAVILFIVILATFIYQYKNFVFSKRVLYFLMLFVLAIQISLVIFTVTSNILTFNFQPKVASFFTITYYIFAYGGASVIEYSLLWFTRILYAVYFHEKQYWMSSVNEEGKPKRNFNLIFKPIVKYCTLTLGIIVLIAFPSHLIFVYVTRLYALFIDDRVYATKIQKNSLDAEIAFKCIHFITFMYCAFVNATMSISLARKMSSGNDKSEGRKRAARNLILIMIFQTTFVLTEGTALGFSIGAHYEPLILVAIFIFHNSCVWLYILSMSFVYGPLDNLTLDSLKKRDHNNNNNATEMTTTVSNKA